MIEQSKTIAVAGASPFALLLAGLLAADHSRQVVLVTGETDPDRLAENHSLSVAPITRPHTWAHLRTHGADALRKIARLAPEAVTRRDVVFQAHSLELVTGLSHVQHMAAGFGHMVERTNGRQQGEGVGVIVRDIHHFHGGRFLHAAQPRLEKSRVRIVRDPSALRVRRNGGARIGGEEIDYVVLADDAAIMDHLGEADCAAIGLQRSMTSVLTAPVAPRTHPITFNVDTGVTIVQAADGSLELIGPVTSGNGPDALAVSLEPGLDPRRAAQTAFRRLISYDGAPVVGMLRRGPTFVVAGLGPLDMMLAPLIARGICGLAHGPEGEWLKAHQPRGRQVRSSVADLAPAFGGA